MFLMKKKLASTPAGNVPTLTAAGVDVCVLANNHVMDWGEPGLLETLDTLHGTGDWLAVPRVCICAE